MNPYICNNIIHNRNQIQNHLNHEADLQWQRRENNHRRINQDDRQLYYRENTYRQNNQMVTAIVGFMPAQIVIYPAYNCHTRW